MAKSCIERYRQCIKLTWYMAEICGANVLKPNYRMTWYTWFVLLAIQVFLVAVVYAIYDGFVVKGDWKSVLASFSVAGSGLQGFCKMIGAITQRSHINSMRFKLDKIYSENEKDSDYASVLQYRIGLTTLMLKAVFFIYFFSLIVIIAFPFVYGKIIGQKLLVLQLLFPGVDPNTDSGYWIQISYQLFCLTLGCFGNFAGDIFLFIVATNVALIKDVVKVKCLKLNRVVRENNDPKRTSALINDILKAHCDYIDYVQEVETAYFGVIFVQIATSMMNICCTLFCVVIKTWPAAPMYLLYSFLILYAYCALGNLVELSNDDLTDLTYSEILWYELPVSQQKNVLLMLRKAQTPIELTVGKVMPLSMASALQLTKTIYTFFMMLVNFLE